MSSVSYLDGEGRDGLGGGQTGGLAGAQVEAGAVQPALDGAVVPDLHLALAQRDGGVAAEVLRPRRPRPVAGDRDVVAPEGHAERLVERHLVEGAGSLDDHHAPTSAKSFSTFLASSASTVVVSDSSISGTPILRIRSLKNPCTTRRRDSFSETPRERR